MSNLLASVGAHFIVGLKGTALESDERREIKELKPAGIVLFKYNFDEHASRWIEKFTDLIKEIQDLTQRENLIVSIDHEGGRVNRLPAPVTALPYAANWGEETAQVGELIGTELRALGFNLNFAPVFDVLSDPSNIVIGPRAFSSDQGEAGLRASQFLRAMQAVGVVGCAKHFPGHGRTKVDSHFDLPIVDCNLAQLQECELVPYKGLNGSEVGLVMTAHVLFPSLDPENPATISKAIITGLLRGRLGYAGPVVTDALEMGAMAKYGAEKLASLAFCAGGDLYLVCQPKDMPPVAKGLALAKDLIRTIDSDPLAQKADQESNHRLAGLFARCGNPLAAGRPSLDMVGCAKHVALAGNLTSAGNQSAQMP